MILPSASLSGETVRRNIDQTSILAATDGIVMINALTPARCAQGFLVPHSADPLE